MAPSLTVWTAWLVLLPHRTRINSNLGPKMCRLCGLAMLNCPVVSRDGQARVIPSLSGPSISYWWNHLLYIYSIRASRYSAQPVPSTNTLIRLTKLVLTLNDFSFNSSHFLKTKGMAMGTRMGPSYTCLFVGYVEQSLFHCYTGTSPHLFLHYIDACIGAASCSHKELEQFINFTNT
eukprot:g33020.t1